MFTYHELKTAPEESKALLEHSVKKFGTIPNLYKILAEAPITHKTYHEAFIRFMKESTLSPVEQQVVFMTANFENNCQYCIPGHTQMMKAASMSDEVVEALREGSEIPDKKLQALRDFTKSLLDHRGHIGDDKLEAFFSAGYTRRQALEVLTGLSAKLISNFTNALAHTEIDPAMKRYAWNHPSER